MSFLNSLKSFFTLKTSDQLRDEAFDKKQEKVNNEDWKTRRHELDYVYESLSSVYHFQNTHITKCKNIIINLLGDEYAGLLNPPIIQQCMVAMDTGSREGAIHLQWATGNEQDQMTVLSVGFSIMGKYRLTCATKCLCSDGITRGTFVSDWLSDIESLPGWFTDVLNIIKTVHSEHITEPNVLADLHIENVVGKRLIENNNRADIVRAIRDIVTYILHDEYQDLAYNPYIKYNSATNNDYWISMELRWAVKNENVSLNVIYYLDRDNLFTVRFINGDTTSQVEKEYAHLTEDQAKQLTLPVWFLVLLQKIKTGTNERSDT